MTQRNTIQSKVQDIAMLAFYPLPKRPILAARAMANGKAYVVIGKDGRIYTTQVNRYTYWTTIERLNDTVQALVKMGLLTDEAITQHREAAQAEVQSITTRRASRDILNDVELAGIKLNARQRAQLEKQAQWSLPG